MNTLDQFKLDGKTALVTGASAGLGAATAIAPARNMRTGNTAALQADETRNGHILERIPAARWGEPEDLTGAAVFLASKASDYL